MICKKCSQEIQDNATFCCHCGTRIEEATQEHPTLFCHSCGAKLSGDGKFCTQCGTPCSANLLQQKVVFPTQAATASSRSIKTILAYVFGVLCAALSLGVRLGMQEVIRVSSLWENTYYLGIDRDIRPLVLLIPGMFAFIISILIVSDKTSGKTKAIAFIVNSVFILLSILCIWYELPRDLFY